MKARRPALALAVLAIVVAACGSSASTAGAGNSAPGVIPGSSSASSVGLPNLPAAGGGSCSVKVTGGTEVSWNSPQNAGSLLVGYWLGASELAVFSLSPDAAYILMNCQSDNGSISLYTTNDTTTAQFPESPGTYVIEAGGLLGDTKPGEIQALVTFPDKSLWRVTDPGSFVVTAFDGHHFAGTFTLNIGQESEDFQSIVATATVSGTFDLNCTATGCK
jgi:hypothetical protein